MKSAISKCKTTEHEIRKEQDKTEERIKQRYSQGKGTRETAR